VPSLALIRPDLRRILAKRMGRINAEDVKILAEEFEFLKRIA
jgi:hypothetical protein